MPGQLIVLPGVTAAAASGAPRINMNAADTIAAKISTLKHAVSARSLSLVSGGGVSGRCRSTGLPLSAKGAGATSMTLLDVGGRRALGLTSPTAVAGLALPPGSLTNSYTLVMAVALGADDIASATSVNLISGFVQPETYNSAALRYYGTPAAAPRTDRFITIGPSTTGTETYVGRVAGAWSVVVVDYNNDTRTLSISVNQAATFNSVVKGAAADQPSDAYLEIGYHLATLGIRNSKVGDLYTFSDSMLKTDLAKAQLAELVSAMNTYYGIA